MFQSEKTEVYGWEAAIRCMHNSMNPCDKSDSKWCPVLKDVSTENVNWRCGGCKLEYKRGDHYVVGEVDHELMMKLRNDDTNYRKFLQMINAYADITAPCYWWSEYDAYKTDTVANMRNTMKKIHEKEFELADFSAKHLTDNKEIGMTFLEELIVILNCGRKLFIETKDKRYWWQIVQLLPQSYNQCRTVKLNYEILSDMYKNEKTNDLDEWNSFRCWIKSLPYSELITENQI